MANSIDCYLLFPYEKLNSEPFDTTDDAILFAMSLPHNKTTVVMAPGYVSIQIRNGNPDREIQPFDKVTHRKHSRITGLARRRDYSPPAGESS